MTLLTILIPSVPSRRKTFTQRLLDELEKQIGDNDQVEILNLYDNLRMPTGEKRNMLLSLARGKYLTFIDDDDMVSPDYITELLNVITSVDNTSDNPIDCITFIQDYYDKGVYMWKCLYSKDYEYTNDKVKKVWTGKPAHTMIWRTEIAKQFTFPNIQNGEDMDWCKRACQLIKREHFINKVLYTYYFDVTTSETSGHIKAKQKK